MTGGARRLSPTRAPRIVHRWVSAAGFTAGGLARFSPLGARRAFHRLTAVLEPRLHLVFCYLLEVFARADDDGHQVVQVVGHTACQESDLLEVLRP